MSYAMEKYGALARKYGYEPVEAAIAAFEAMHTRAVRVAEDPWAVVTRAVELTLIYDQRADGLLCSNHQARREAGHRAPRRRAVQRPRGRARRLPPSIRDPRTAGR